MINTTRTRLLFAMLASLAMAASGQAPSADLLVYVAKSPLGNSVEAGANITWRVYVQNAGPDTAEDVVLFITIADGSFVSLSSPSGWSCTPPPVGSGPGGFATCTIASLSAGTGSDFYQTAQLASDLPSGYFLTGTAIVDSATPDPNTLTNQSTAVVGVVAPTIPTLQPRGRMALFALLAAAAVFSIRRRLRLGSPPRA